MRLPRRCAPRNDRQSTSSVHPEGELCTANDDKPVSPSFSCLQAQAVEKAPDARKAEEASADSTAAVRQASSRRPDNADGALSAAAHQQRHDGFLDVQPILRLIENYRLRPFNHVIGNFLAPVGRQTVQHNRAFISYS